MSELVDLERLREGARTGVGWFVKPPDLEALLAVVDAAREADAFLADPDGGPVESLNLGRRALRDALEPFTPPADRAWEEVDRWNAERDLAVKAAVDVTRDRVPRVPPGAFQAVLDRDRNPRDRARDQLADAGVAVQRQFRSDQERIAELERELAEACDIVDAARWYWRDPSPDAHANMTDALRRLDMSETRWVGAKR